MLLRRLTVAPGFIIHRSQCVLSPREIGDIAEIEAGPARPWASKTTRIKRAASLKHEELSSLCKISLRWLREAGTRKIWSVQFFRLSNRNDWNCSTSQD